MQVDVSQTSFVAAGLLAMFRKLGQPVKTVVAPAVLEAVSSGNVSTSHLEWGAAVKGRVATGQAAFYTLFLTQEDLDTGFVIFASCPNLRLKILLWDRQGAALWNPAAQEDCTKIGTTYVAAIYHTQQDVLEGVPKSVQVQDCPSRMLIYISLSYAYYISPYTRGSLGL
jgi:hypothetical protein